MMSGTFLEPAHAMRLSVSLTGRRLSRKMVPDTIYTFLHSALRILKSAMFSGGAPPVQGWTSTGKFQSIHGILPDTFLKSQPNSSVLVTQDGNEVSPLAYGH